MKVVTVVSRSRKTIPVLMNMRVTKEPELSILKVFENARNSQNLRVIPANLLPQA